MTVTTTANRSGPYTTASVGPFDYDFSISVSSEITIIKTSTADVESTLVLDTDYTLTGVGDPNGGTFTLTVALVSGEKATAILNIPLTQPTDLLTQGTFSAEVHEAIADRLTRQNQKQQEELDRTAKVAVSSDLDATELTVDDFIKRPTLLDSATLASDATVTLTTSDTASYDWLQLDVLTLVGDSTPGQLRMQFTSAAGAAYTDATYSHSGLGRGSDGTALTWEADLDTSAELCDSGGETWAGAPGGNLEILIGGLPADESAMWWGQAMWTDGSAHANQAMLGGQYSGANAVAGVKLWFETSDMTGTVRLWGIPKT